MNCGKDGGDWIVQSVVTEKIKTTSVTWNQGRGYTDILVEGWFANYRQRRARINRDGWCLS